MSIDYERFARVMTRSIEIADESDANQVVVSVFKETLADDATKYSALNRAVSKAMTDFAKENREALEALSLLDAPYRLARAAVAAILPGADVPDTLKSQPTDTDKLNAMRNAYGPSSKQYKRIHIRQSAGSDTSPPAGRTGGTGARFGFVTQSLLPQNPYPNRMPARTRVGSPNGTSKSNA